MAEQSDFQSSIQMLADRMDRQDTRLEHQEVQQQTTNDLLLRMLNQQEALVNLHQNFQKSQEALSNCPEKADERQDQFNIIFLDEIRGMKKDVKKLTDAVLKQHKGRPKRLEDFMDGLMRQAG